MTEFFSESGSHYLSKEKKEEIDRSARLLVSELEKFLEKNLLPSKVASYIMGKTDELVSLDGFDPETLFMLSGFLTNVHKDRSILNKMTGKKPSTEWSAEKAQEVEKRKKAVVVAIKKSFQTVKVEETLDPKQFICGAFAYIMGLIDQGKLASILANLDVRTLRTVLSEVTDVDLVELADMTLLDATAETEREIVQKRQEEVINLVRSRLAEVYTGDSA